MSTYNDEFLYSFETNDGWALTKEDDEYLVYVYGNEEPTKLIPGLETELPTDKIPSKKCRARKYKNHIRCVGTE